MCQTLPDDSQRHLGPTDCQAALHGLTSGSNTRAPGVQPSDAATARHGDRAAPHLVRTPRPPGNGPVPVGAGRRAAERRPRTGVVITGSGRRRPGRSARHRIRGTRRGCSDQERAFIRGSCRRQSTFAPAPGALRGARRSPHCGRRPHHSPLTTNRVADGRPRRSYVRFNRSGVICDAAFAGAPPVATAISAPLPTGAHLAAGPVLDVVDERAVLGGRPTATLAIEDHVSGRFGRPLGVSPRG